MKKLLLFHMFCLVYVISDAQVVPKKIEGKPEYKETVEFIKSAIALPLFNDGLDGGYSPVKGIYLKRMYKIKELKFTDCVMEVRYVIEETTSGLGLVNQHPEIETFSAVIDFSKVESISWVSVGETYCLIGLQFKIKGLNKEVKIELPISRIDCQQPIKWEELKDLKIFKAFNHFRKMCGAPEPVEF
jgi:hypothetical protein